MSDGCSGAAGRGPVKESKFLQLLSLFDLLAPAWQLPHPVVGVRHEPSALFGDWLRC
jgi:hypothetical protein